MTRNVQQLETKWQSKQIMHILLGDFSPRKLGDELEVYYSLACGQVLAPFISLILDCWSLVAIIMDEQV